MTTTDNAAPVQPPDDGPVYDPQREAAERRERELASRSYTARAAADGTGPRNGAASGVPDGPELDVSRVQAAVEGVVHGDRVEFAGEWFRISGRVGLMPLMKFANAADDDIDTSDMRALSALYDLLRDCIYGGTETGDDPAVAKLGPDDKGYDAGDWRKFERHATRVRAQADDLLAVVRQVIEILTARPTR